MTFALTSLASLLVAIAPAPITTSFADPCKLSLSASSVNLVWSSNFATQQINFTVNKSSNPSCTYAVTFSKGNNTSSDYNRRMASGSNTLNYQLYKESSLSNILKEYPDVTSTSDVVTGSFGFGQNQSQTQTYFVQIPYNLATQPRLKPPGNYTDTFILKVYDTSNSSDPSRCTTPPDDTANVSLSTIIARIIQLSIIPTGSGFDPNSTTQNLNFGTLTEGQSLGFDVRVLSNAGYSISFSSQNNGALKLIGSTSTTPSTTVPYTLSVNSTQQSLSNSRTNPVNVANGSGQTTTSGVASTVVVTIGAVVDKMAGSYSDNITVTAATTE